MLVVSYAREQILLIEPVWNRNTGFTGGTVDATALLIEPVWNRNIDPTQRGGGGGGAFNRTSMESKQRQRHHKHKRKRHTFNRTSMESKRGFMCHYPTCDV